MAAIMTNNHATSPSHLTEEVQAMLGPWHHDEAWPAFGGCPSDAAALRCYGPRIVYSEELPQNVRDMVPKALTEKLDLPHFHAALGRLLGNYRYHEAEISGQPAVAAVIEQVKAAREAVHQAFMHVYHLSPMAKNLLRELSPNETRYAQHADPVFARAADLLQMVNDVSRVYLRLDTEFKKKGRPPEWRRDDLLADVCELARAHATEPLQWQEAGKLAESILTAARITVPSSVDEILRIVREVRKQRNVTEPHGTPADADGNDTTDMGKTHSE